VTWPLPLMSSTDIWGFDKIDVPHILPGQPRPTNGNAITNPRMIGFASRHSILPPQRAVSHRQQFSPDVRCGAIALAVPEGIELFISRANDLVVNNQFKTQICVARDFEIDFSFVLSQASQSAV
jgi:hypothetical protein